MNVRRLQLDVDKAIQRPGLIELAEAIDGVPGVQAVTLALRVGGVALISSVFTVFVAEYGQLRAELARAEHELSFTHSGRLAAGHLGRQVAREAAVASAIASGASFIGAFTPLLIGAAIATYSWSALIVSVAALGALGGALATSVAAGSSQWWSWG